MAEKRKKVSYQYKGDQLDLEAYLHNLDNNVSKYIASKNWTADLVEEFKKAYDVYSGAFKDQLQNNTNRFSTNAHGEIVDSQGEFSSKDDDGIDPNGSEYYYNVKTGERITTNDYNRLGDEASKKIFKKKHRNPDMWKPFNANVAVATYFRDAAESPEIRPHLLIQNEPLTTFSLDLYHKDWKNKYNPGNDASWQSLIDDDVYDEKTGKRDRKVRLGKLALFTLNWMDNFDPDQYSFEGTAYTDANDLKNRMATFKAALDSGDWAQVEDSARNLGIDNKWLNNYLTDKKEVIAEKKEGEESDDAAPNFEEQFRKQGIKLGYEGEELETFVRENLRSINRKKTNALNDLVTANDDADYDAWLSSYTPIEKENINLHGFDTSKAAGPWTRGKVKILKDGYDAASDKFQYMKDHFGENVLASLDRGQRLINTYALRDWARGNASKKINGKNEYYLPWTINSDAHTVYTFDPGAGFIYKRSTLNMDNAEIKAALRELYNGTLPKHQTGGSLQKMGNMVDVDAELLAAMKKQQLAEKRKRLESVRKTNNYLGVPLTNRTDKQKEAGAKTSNLTGSAEDIWDHLSTEDKQRLGLAALDIISAGSAYVPTYGTAVSAGTGLASTLGTLALDATDDSISTGSALKNFGANLGADVLGLIPGFGTSSKISKIVKTLKSVQKPLMYALTALNVDTTINAADSLAKILKDPSKASKDDIISVMRGLQVVVGKGGKQFTSRKQLKNATTTSGKYSVKTADGQTKTLTQAQVDEINALKSDADKNARLRLFLGGSDPADAFKSRGRNGSWNPTNWSFRSSNPSFEADQIRYLNSSAKGPMFSNDWWYRKLGFKRFYNNPVADHQFRIFNVATPAHVSTPQGVTFLNPMFVRPQGVSQGSNNWRQGMTPDQQQAAYAAIFAKRGVKLSTESLRKLANGGEIPVFQNGGTPNTQRSIKKYETPAGPLTLDSLYKESAFDPQLYPTDWANDFKSIKGNELVAPFTIKQIGSSGFRYVPSLPYSESSGQAYEANDWYTLYDKIRALRDKIPGDKGKLYFRTLYNNSQLDGSTAGFSDKDGNERTVWESLVNDAAGRKPIKYTNADDYEYHIRHDQTLGPGHNIDYLVGNRYYYKNKEGKKVYISYDLAKKYNIAKTGTVDISNFNKDLTKWTDYEVTAEPVKLTGPGSTTGVEQEKPDPENVKTQPSATKWNPDPNALADALMFGDNIFNNNQLKESLRRRIPLLRNRSQLQLRIFGDYPALQAAQQNRGELNNAMSQPTTTDAAQLAQQRLEGTIQGNKGWNEAVAKDKLAIDTSGEKVLANEKANMDERNEDAFFNREQYLKNFSNIIDDKLSTRFLNWNNIKARAMERIQDLKTKKLEMKSYEEIANQLRAKDMVLTNPTSYGLSLTDVDLYTSYEQGTLDPNELATKNPAKFQQLSRVMSKLARALQLAQLDLHGIHYQGPTYQTKKDNSVLTYYQLPKKKKGGKLKDGSKIEVAKIRERRANADRFQKGILKFLERNQKVLDRVAKSMYKYP